MRLIRWTTLVLFTTAGPFCIGAPSIIPVTLPTNDIVYDPISDRMIAAVPSRAGALRGNTITVIDPYTGALGPSVFVASEPNLLALADDGSRVYVSSKSTNFVTPFSLLTMSPGTPFPIGTVGHRVSDMEVVPGNTTALVVSSIEGERLAAFVDGVELVMDVRATANVIEFGPSPGIVYGHAARNLQAYPVDLSPLGGVGARIFLSDQLLTVPSKDMKYDNGRMYFTNGQIVDVSIPAPTGLFTASGPVEPVSSTGRTYFVEQNKLKSFSQATFVPLGEMTISEFAGTAQDLIALGGSALALTTTSDQLFIIRLPGDHDGSGVVTAADYELWRASYGSTTNLAADANHDQIVDAADYVLWRDNLGQTLVGIASGASSTQLSVPEPAPAMLLCVALVCKLAAFASLSRRRIAPKLP